MDRYRSSAKDPIAHLQRQLTELQEQLRKMNSRVAAGLPYSRVNLAGSIVDSDVSPTAGIFRYKTRIGVTVVAGAHTVGANEDLILASGTITITLPGASTNPGKVVTVKKTDTIPVVTISGAGTDKIEGVSTVTLTRQYQQMSLVSDGVATWYIIGVGRSIADADIVSAAGIAFSKLANLPVQGPDNVTQRKLAIGSATYTWPGAAVASSALAIAHGLGVTPISVELTPGARSGITLFPSCGISTLDATNINTIAHTIDGQTPAAASTCTVYWMAVS